MNPDTPITLYRMKGRLAGDLGVPDVPIPVRSSTAPEIFGPEGVDVERLVRELAELIDGDLQLSATLGNVLARLADVAATRRALDGDLDTAIDLFETGLRYRPGYVGLNTKLALALQASGRPAEAAHHYDVALIRRDEPDNWLAMILAARAHAESGDPTRALEVLDRLPGELLDSAGLRKLYLQMSDEEASLSGGGEPG